jgi:hypothetical protein
LLADFVGLPPAKISMAEIYYPRKLLAGMYKIVERAPGGSAILAQKLPLKAHQFASAVAPALRLLTAPNLDDRYKNTRNPLSKEIWNST